MPTLPHLIQSTIGVGMLVGICVLLYETWRAPTVDEHGHVIQPRESDDCRP